MAVTDHPRHGYYKSKRTQVGKDLPKSFFFQELTEVNVKFLRWGRKRTPLTRLSTGG
jgi:hypothetical protein